MDTLKMHSLDGVQRNIEMIGKLFPNAITEVKRNGKVEHAIDFDVLRQELSDSIVEGQEERYQFTWPDKKKAMLAANAPITATLRPVVADSVGKDGTPGGFDSENLYIEGDNLEVLKLLQETYLGKVKMIYIDPPYNTGNDMLYDDNFTQTSAEYMENSGQLDKERNRLVTNPESNGRFHTDWLNMIFPRLRLAKSLLAEDGVVFISIDDGELDNLRKVCDEVFGSSNFVADLCVVNNLKGRNDKKYIARANERIVMYVKSQEYSEHGLSLGDDVLKEYKEEDSKGRYRLLELRKRGGQDTRKDRPNMYYSFYVNPETGDVSLERNATYSCEALPVKSNGVDGRWRWGKETALKNIQYLYGKIVGNKYNIYEKDYLLAGRASGGWQFIFVEFENPYNNIVVKDGDWGMTVRKGLKQIRDWQAFIAANYAVLYEEFKKYTPKILTEEFFRYDPTRMHYAVVAGRRQDFDDPAIRVLQRQLKKESDIKLLHYDNLLDDSRRLIGMSSY